MPIDSERAEHPSRLYGSEAHRSWHVGVDSGVRSNRYRNVVHPAPDWRMTPVHPDDLLLTLPILALGTISLLVALGLVVVGSQRAAEAKGDALLRSWLSDEQACQWDLYRHFETIGSDTRKRYRLRRGREMNIDELDFDGKVLAHWCFAPFGNLVTGDILLAQKIALETI
jgi:hypothetical protein